MTLIETIYPSKTPYNITLPGSSGTLSMNPKSISMSSSSPSSPGQNSSSYRSKLPPGSSSTDIIGSSSTNAVPSSNPSCVVQDGLVVTERDGESFQALCFTNFTGPTGIGLDEPTYRACLQQCSLNNDGFSDISCYGISYFPDRAGPNCYLKTKAGVVTVDYNPNYRVVSGRLLFNSTNIASNIALPSNSSSIVWPTGSPFDCVSF